MRAAMNRSKSGLIVRSCFETAYHDGLTRQAAAVVLAVVESAATFAGKPVEGNEARTRRSGWKSFRERRAIFARIRRARCDVDEGCNVRSDAGGERHRESTSIHHGDSFFSLYHEMTTCPSPNGAAPCRFFTCIAVGSTYEEPPPPAPPPPTPLVLREPAPPPPPP